MKIKFLSLSGLKKRLRQGELVVSTAINCCNDTVVKFDFMGLVSTL